MSISRRLLIGALVLYFGAIASHAAWWLTRPQPRSWAEADWSASGILPPAKGVSPAQVMVLAGRTGRWKGIFAHHTWIVVKPDGAARYRRLEVVGWGDPVRRDAYPADGRWFSNTPEIVLRIDGPAAQAIIPRIEAAVARYPHSARGSYRVWPGPNSNTFVAAIARAVPELAPGILPTSVGQSYGGAADIVRTTPGGTGIHVSLSGLLGLRIDLAKGFEFELLTLIMGVDWRRPAVLLPGWGRVAFR